MRTDLKGTGLGNVLMDKITRYHCARHTGEIGAQILAENGPMLKLAHKWGFIVHPSAEPDVVECVLRLDSLHGRNIA